MKTHINRWLAVQEPLLPAGNVPLPDRAANLALRDTVRELETIHGDSDWKRALRVSLAWYLWQLLAQWQECLLLHQDIQLGVPQR